MRRKLLKLICLGAIGVVNSLLIVSRSIKKKKHVRRVWSRNWHLARNSGKYVANLVFDELKLEDPSRFKNFCRMDEENFNTILMMVKPRIQKQDTNMREAITAKTRLLITLRYLATGETFQSLSYIFRVSVTSVSEIVDETSKAIYISLKKEFLKCPNNTTNWLEVAKEFETQWDFPLCLGAFDGKHIAFKAKKDDGSFFFNYKGFNSIILLALVDANYKFLYVDIGCNGRVHDSRVLHECEFYKKAIVENYLNLPESGVLPGTHEVVPYVFIADDAFTLSTRLMNPVRGDLSDEQKIYNYRLSRARRVLKMHLVSWLTTSEFCNLKLT